MRQAARIPFGKLKGRELSEGMIRITVGVLRRIAASKGAMIDQLPELCAAAIGWAQRAYTCDHTANLRVRLPTTAEELRHDGAQETLRLIAFDIEAFCN